VSLQADPRIGTELAGYRLERLLGRGGMSVVYLAEDLRLSRRVALKLLAPELAEDTGFRERFLRESRLAASLDHPNVIPIYEAGEAEGVLFIAMRYVDGTDLKALLAAEGTLEPARALGLLDQVAEALDVAHGQGLIHRDVKPGNVLIDARAGREHVYLSDFGLTKQTGSESGLTETGQFMGTADYVSPEQVARQPATAASDLYALGCVLYECLAGEPPFRAESLMGVLYGHVNEPVPSLHDRRPELPEAVDPVMERALAKDPGLRQPSCRELVDDARSALEVRAEPSAAAGLTRRRLLIAGGVVVLSAAAAASAVLLTRRDDGETAPLVAAPGSVVRIDPATNQPVAAVSLEGWSGTGPIAVGGGAVWVANLLDGTVSRIDPDAGVVTKTVSVRGSTAPLGIAVGDGTVWVAGSFEGTGTLTEIDAATGRVRRTYSFDRADPVGVALDAGAVWVSANDLEGPALLRLDPATGAQVAEIPLPMQVGAVAAGEGSVWTASAPVSAGGAEPGSGAVWRIDPATNEIVATTDLTDVVALALGEGAVWIARGYSGAVGAVRLDPATNAVVATVEAGSVGTSHTQIISVGAGAVWLAGQIQGTVLRIDPATNTAAATIDLREEASPGVATNVGPYAISAGEEGVWTGIFG
jgi:serine/threonine-protein kinase